MPFIFILVGLFTFTSHAKVSKKAFKIPSKVEIKRYYYTDDTNSTYGTFFRHWKGWVTAGHVITEMNGGKPRFIKGEFQNYFDRGRIDAATANVELPQHSPRMPIEGEEVVVYGFPAGSSQMASRRGRIYTYRTDNKSWIVNVFNPSEPVVVGMSGGPVFSVETSEIVGLVVSSNSRTDVFRNGTLHESFNMVTLHDLWHELKNR